MAKILLLILLTVSIFFETTIFSFPLFLILGIALLLLDSSTLIATLIFIEGLILDTLRLEVFGITPLIIFATTTIIYIYRRSFEVTHFGFVLVCIFLSAYFYASLTDHYFNIIIYLAFMIVSFLAYLGLLKFSQKT